MKLKYALVALASAAFAAVFAINTASADDPQCARACLQTYNICIQYSPQALCRNALRQCQEGCGTFD